MIGTIIKLEQFNDISEGKSPASISGSYMS